jgi:hypothetical protein
MNARIVSFATVLDIVVLVGLGLGMIFAPLTLIWAFDDGFSTDLLMSWAAAVDIWLLGHGVPLSFTVPPDLADALSLGALSRDFTVDVALLGIGLLTLLWGFRIGRRETTAAYPLLVWTIAVGTLVLVSLALVAFMPQQVVSMPLIDALVRPALFLATGLAVAAWVGPHSSGKSLLHSALPESLANILRAGFTAGSAAVAGVVSFAAVAVAVLLVASFATVITIFESLQPGVMGLIALAVAQLALLPTLIVWAATWIVGPGFSLGTGALVSPLGTNLQIVPALPVLGIVPTDPPVFAFAIVAIPVLAAFILGVAVGPRVVGNSGLVSSLSDTDFFSQPLVKLAATAAVAGAVSAGFGGLLASLTSGSLGPGRFQLVGPDPAAVMLWWGLEVTLGVLLGSIAAVLNRSGQRAGR